MFQRGGTDSDIRKRGNEIIIRKLRKLNKSYYSLRRTPGWDFGTKIVVIVICFVGY